MGATSKHDEQEWFGPPADWQGEIEIRVKAKGWGGGYSGLINDATSKDYNQLVERLATLVRQHDRIGERIYGDEKWSGEEDEASWQHGHLPEEVQG